MAGAVHGQAGDERGLRRAGARADERLETDPPRRLGRDQRAVHRTQPAVERELAEHEHLARALARQLVARGQDRDRHREVVPRAELGDVAGSEVDHDAPLGPPQLARDDARAHPLARLGDRTIGQADDDRRAVLAAADAGLDLHELSLDSDRRLAVGGGDHEDEARPDQCYGKVTGANASAPGGLSTLSLDRVVRDSRTTAAWIHPACRPSLNLLLPAVPLECRHCSTRDQRPLRAPRHPRRGRRRHPPRCQRSVHGVRRALAAAPMTIPGWRSMHPSRAMLCRSSCGTSQVGSCAARSGEATVVSACGS